MAIKINRVTYPEKLYISSSLYDTDDMIHRTAMEIKERLEMEALSRLEKEGHLTANEIREMFGMPVIKTKMYEPFAYNPVTNTIYKINETEKETKKMEAKKCDRCGKLYEMPGACENPNGANVRFKFEKVYRAEEKSGTKIAEEQSKDIYIKYGFTKDTFVDFCPDCRASLKKWFENPEKEGK